MTTYYNETFEGVTPPALPANWSTFLNTGTVTSSASFAHAGSNSLKLSPGTNKHTYVWNTTPDTNNGITIMDVWFYVPTVSGTDLSVCLWLRGQNSVTTDFLPASYNVSLDVFGTTFNQLTLNHATNGSGTSTTLVTHNPTGFKTLFSLGAWYRLVFCVRDIHGDVTTIPGGTYGIGNIISAGIQRGSDGFWIVNGGASDSWVDTGVVTYLASIRRSNVMGALHWGSGTAGIMSFANAASMSVYYDDIAFYDYTEIPSIRSLPTWTPGNSVELQGTGIVVDGVATNLYDGDLTTNYQSTARYEAWAGLDLGSGNTATLTRVLVSADFEGPGSTNVYEYMAKHMVVEAATAATTGPWTQIGTLCQEANNRPNYIPCPITAGSAYRYFRVINHDLPCYLAELRFEGQLGAGTPAWQPIRPVLSPAAGKFANGSTVTMTTPTTGASIYYTLDGSTPTTGSTLYSGAVTLPSNAVTTVKAISFHASGTTTSSAVTTGVFSCPQQFISDTGATRYGSTFRWCEDLYDDQGFLANLCYPGMLLDGGKLYLFGENHMNPNNGTTGTPILEFWCYSTTDYYNYHYEFNFGLPPTHNTWCPTTGDPLYTFNRLHVFRNPSPIDPNKTYVGICDPEILGGTAFLTSPAITGPWKWYTYIKTVSAGLTVRDQSLFKDPANGKIYHIFNSTGSFVYAMELDATTDYTSYTGSPLQLDNSVTPAREAPWVFATGGCYFVVSSALTNFGDANSRMVYKAVQAASLAAGAATLTTTAWSNLWASGAGSPTVAYSAQASEITSIPGRKGFMMSMNLCDPGESPINVSHMRALFWPLPLSAITTGASPSISITPPATWTIAGSLPLPPALISGDNSLSSFAGMGL